MTDTKTSLPQAYDFCEESNAVYDLLSNLSDNDFNEKTQFKGWTINNVIGHLHVWNHAADLSLKDGEEWKNFANAALEMFGKGSTMNQFEETITQGKQGKELLDIWKNYYEDMTTRFAVADPKKRVEQNIKDGKSFRLFDTIGNSKGGTFDFASSNELWRASLDLSLIHI